MLWTTKITEGKVDNHEAHNLCVLAIVDHHVSSLLISKSTLLHLLGRAEQIIMRLS